MDVSRQNLYEIPSCSVCLTELNTNIISLACGHCFHRICIQNAMLARRDCPICRRKVNSGEIRTIYFDFILRERDQQEGQIKRMKQDLDKMEMLLKSYQEVVKFIDQKICQEEEQNAQLRKQVEVLQGQLIKSQQTLDLQKATMNNRLKGSRKNQNALIRQVKVLKVLLKAKQQKQRYINTVNGTSMESRKNIKKGLLNEVKVGGRLNGLRRSFSEPKLK